MKEAILKILEEWNKSNGDFDAMWHGYDILLDELKHAGHLTTLSQLRKEMKQLHKEGIVELRPTYDCDYLLGGRGWFLTDKI